MSLVRCERPEPGIGLITIDRPDRLNALNLEVKRSIEHHVRALAADPAIAVLILTGSPTVFVAGTDLAEMRDMTPMQHTVHATDGVFLALRACPKPVIAAVEGYALGGGCELALACDMIVAGAGARFGQPEIKVGIMPGAGGTQLLLRTVGKYRAMKMVLTGEHIPAAEALAMGLLSEVVAAGEARSRALALAGGICAMPPLAVRAIKQAIQAGQDMPLSAALAMERTLFQLLFDTDDQVEGMQAFVEKRRPVFHGR